MHPRAGHPHPHSHHGRERRRSDKHQPSRNDARMVRKREPHMPGKLSTLMHFVNTGIWLKQIQPD